MTDEPHDQEANEGRMRRIYALVLVVEVVVIAALWSFSHYFSS